MSLLDKLKGNSRIKESAVLSESKFFGTSALVSTPVPMLNAALSGSLDGGLGSGLTVIAGPSKHFKSNVCLLMAASYLTEHKDAIMIFYDSEFGSTPRYFESFGIDTSRVLHTPIVDIEELKFDLVNQLENIERKDKVIIVIDSVGNLASKKELQDAKDEKSVQDMTRAKALKGLFRMVTPYLTMKDVPCVAIAHVYQELGLFPKAIVSGGTGIMLSANTVWIMGRQQDKVGTEIQGYHFIINVEKSRFVKEKSKIPISVSYEGGVMRSSGLLDLALEEGSIRKVGNFVQLLNFETGEYDEKKIRSKAIPKEFYNALVKHQPFYDFVKNKYTLGTRQMFLDNDDDSDVEEIGEDE